MGIWPPLVQRLEQEISLLRSNRLGAVIEHHGVLGFGKKQPALDDEAESRARDGKPRRDRRRSRRRPAAQQGQSQASAKPASRAMRRRRARCLRAIRKPISLQQVILFGMRRLEHAHLAPAAEQGRAGDRAGRRSRVDRAPICFLQPPCDDHQDDGRDCHTRRARLPQPDEKIENEEARSSGRAQNSSARPMDCAIDGSASATRRSCRCNRSSPPRGLRRESRKDRPTRRSTPKNTQPMPKTAAGKNVRTEKTPSRDSQDERHCEKARQARSGRPR